MRVTSAAVVALLGFGLVACSGGDDDDAAATTTVTPSSAASTLTAASTTTAPPTTTTVQTTTTTAAPTTTLPPTTTTEQITTTTVDLVAAAAYYIDAVTPLNCSLQTIALIEADVAIDEFYDENEWPEIRDTLLPAYKAHADTQLAFMNALLGYTWPEAVQADIDALVAETAAEANTTAAWASIATFDQFIGRAQYPERSAATLVRAKLGLPSNVENDENYCQELDPPPSTAPAG